MNYKNIFLVFALGVSGLSYGMPFEGPCGTGLGSDLEESREKLRARIEQLIEQKGDLNARMGDEFSNPPLLGMAYNESNADLLEKLLQNGASPNVKNWDGGTALHNAVLHGNNVQGARLLLQYGAQCNMKERLVGWTPLAQVARSDSPSLDLVKVLLEYNADPNIQNKFGETSLFEAIAQLADDSESLKHYREKDEAGMIKWFQGKIETRKEIITLLLHHGANPLITSTRGKNADKNAINLAQEKCLNDIVLLLQERREQMIDRLARFLSHPEDGLPLPPEIIRVIAEFRYSYDENPPQPPSSDDTTSLADDVWGWELL